MLDQRLDAVFEDISLRNHKDPLARKITIIQHYAQNKLNEMMQ